MTQQTSPLSPADSDKRVATRPSFSPELFDRLWTIDDVAEFGDISERQAWKLMARPEAPPRLHLGARTVRWDPTAVVAFILGTGAQDYPEPRTDHPRLSVVPEPSRVTVISAVRSSPQVIAKARPVTRAMRRTAR